MSPLLLQSTFGRPNRFWESLFPVCGALSWGGGGGGGAPRPPPPPPPPPPPLTRPHVFEVPFEEDDRSLDVAFEAYGAVTSVKKQTFLSN